MIISLAAAAVSADGGGSGSLALLLVYVAVAIGVSFLCSIMEAVLLSVTPAYIGALEPTKPAVAARLRELKDDVDRPLAITGTGIVSPAGVGVDAFTTAVREDANCLGPLPLSVAHDLPVQVGGRVMADALADVASGDRAVKMGALAVEEALEAARRASLSSSCLNSSLPPSSARLTQWTVVDGLHVLPVTSSSSSTTMPTSCSSLR